TISSDDGPGTAPAVTVTVPELSVLIGMRLGVGKLASVRLVAEGTSEIVIGPAGAPDGMLKDTWPSPTVWPLPSAAPEPMTEKRSAAVIGGGLVPGGLPMFGPNRPKPSKMYGAVVVAVVTPANVMLLVEAWSPKVNPPIVNEPGPVFIRVTSKVRPELPA